MPFTDSVYLEKEPTSISLSSFRNWLADAAKDFETYYVARHADDPDAYPLDEFYEYEWYDHFESYLESHR